MERSLYKELKIWKEKASYLPLIVRGARQVGKSYLIEKFGREEFSNLYVINFEKKPQLMSCFKSLDPKDILKDLQLQLGVTLRPGMDLLFLDEIQDCPQALKSLRYFAEEMPKQHVIAAGSLLEFILEDKNFSFPVGRVEIMNLGPLSFLEYLASCEQKPLVDLLLTVESPDQISAGVHEHLLGFVREFLCIGGMPGVISTFKSSASFLEAKRRQSGILDLYALDFGKYATKYAQHHHLKKLFEKMPDLVGKHFKFSKIDPDCANPARDYRQALNRIRQARLIIPVHMSKGNALPLRSEKSEKKFKVFLLDVGLLVFGLGWENLDLGNIMQNSSFRGIVAEQLVAQELNTLQDPFIDRGLYYWENISHKSSAEIDFLINLNGKMLPIEVKSGAIGRLKSLRQYMELKKIDIGIRICEKCLAFDNGILSVPFYLISQIPRLLKIFES